MLLPSAENSSVEAFAVLVQIAEDENNLLQAARVQLTCLSDNCNRCNLKIIFFIIVPCFL